MRAPNRRDRVLHMIKQAEQTNIAAEPVARSESIQDAGTTNTGEQKQATGKQLVAIIFILSLATKMFLLPIFLIQSTGRDAYIIVSVFCAFDLITLAITLVTMRLANVDFFELITSVTGKVGAKIIVSVIGIFLFFKLNISVAEILAFYGTNVFTDFDTSLMVIVLLVFLAAAGTHTLRALCRLNELLVPLIVLCLFILVSIVVMTGFDLANIFPAVRDPGDFSDGLVHYGSWIGDFTPLVLFIGRTKTKKRTGIFAVASGTIGSAVAVFFALVLSAAFGNVPSLVDSTTNLSNILQFTVGNMYGRLDMFSSILWSVSVFIEAALFFYSTCRCISFVIGKNTHVIISLCTSVAVYAVQVFALIDPTIFSTVVTSLACSVTVPIITLAIPVLALICALISRKRQRLLK